MRYDIAEEISFRKLEVLLVFLDAGSLARAAEQLGTSTVSVHRALHSLEEGLRCPLFRLEGRQLVPTEAARALADAAQGVLQQMADGIRATRQMAGFGARRLRVGSLYSLTARTVPLLVTGLQQQHPELQVELQLGSNAELLRWLREGRIDAALVATADGEGANDLVVFPLFDDDIHYAALAGAKPVQADEVDLSRCAGERFVALSDGFITASGFEAACRRAGFEPDVVMRTRDIFSLMNLVKGGVGATLLPGRVRDVLPPGVVMRPLAPAFRARQTIALHMLRSRERDPSLLALLAVSRARRDELG